MVFTLLSRNHYAVMPAVRTLLQQVVHSIRPRASKFLYQSRSSGTSKATWPSIHTNFAVAHTPHDDLQPTSLHHFLPAVDPRDIFNPRRDMQLFDTTSPMPPPVLARHLTPSSLRLFPRRAFLWNSPEPLRVQQLLPVEIVDHVQLMHPHKKTGLTCSRQRSSVDRNCASAPAPASSVPWE